MHTYSMSRAHRKFPRRQGFSFIKKSLRNCRRTTLPSDTISEYDRLLEYRQGYYQEEGSGTAVYVVTEVLVKDGGLGKCAATVVVVYMPVVAAGIVVMKNNFFVVLLIFIEIFLFKTVCLKLNFVISFSLYSTFGKNTGTKTI